MIILINAHLYLIPTGAPPDYFSIISQIQDLRAENSNHFVFLRKAGLVLLNTG